MTYAALTGWGKCMPPAVLSNADLATFLETDDAWITTRTGIRERRVSHAPLTQMAHVAAARALACAGLDAKDVDLIVLGSCSYDEQVPNSASGVQALLGATSAAAMDVNTACTSFLYGLSSANAMIRTGVVRNAVVIGVEWISPFMDWSNRNVAVLFGDGAAAVVLQATEERQGVLGEKLGCYAESRHILRVRGMGSAYANRGVPVGTTNWDFDGQEIFKKAVLGMTEASAAALAKAGLGIQDIDLVVPHQANLRIIEAVGKRIGADPARVFLTVERYGNMSAATVPVALVDAVEEGRVKPGAKVLTPAFGGGLTYCAHVIQWGERTTPLGKTDVDLVPCEETALAMVQQLIAKKRQAGPATEGLAAPLSTP
jgi:3-oxoacyl-[acyl-carrier-protein] synthase III